MLDEHNDHEEENKPLQIHTNSEQPENEKKVEEDRELKIHHKGKKGEMRRIEKDIIAALTKLSTLKHTDSEYHQYQDQFTALIDSYQKEPFGNSTEAFLNASVAKRYFNDLHAHQNREGWALSYLSLDNQLYPLRKFRLWTLIESYTLESSKIKKHNYLSRIKKILQEVSTDMYHASGQGLFDLNSDLIKNIYLSNDTTLINLVMTHKSTKLPVPNLTVFADGPIPAIIQQRQLDIEHGIKNFLDTRAKLGENTTTTIETVTEIQRHFRGKRRQQQEQNRLAEYPNVIEEYGQNNEGKYFKRERTAEERRTYVLDALKDANTPYKPRGCSPELSEKIMNAASKVNLFSNIRHLSSEAFLKNILDEGLFGRKTLLETYIPFKPAALHTTDLKYGGGDANVICFGPNAIDPKAEQKDRVEITMDVEKLNNNRCVFYKQKDLGLEPEGVQKINFAKEGERPMPLRFIRDTQLRMPKIGHTNIQFQDSHGSQVAYSQLPNYLFTAYDLSNMHQILTLNFFRFIDNLVITDEKYNDLAKNIYRLLNNLSESELIKKLQEIGSLMTQQTEFNFYGAYKIDFNALLSIKTKSFTLDVPLFHQQLREGNMAKLNEAKVACPTLFTSHRFLDHLLDEAQAKQYPEDIVKALMEIQAKCQRPSFLHILEHKKQEKMPSFTQHTQLNTGPKLEK